MLDLVFDFDSVDLDARHAKRDGRVSQKSQLIGLRNLKNQDQ